MTLEDIKSSLSALRQHGMVRSLELQLGNRAYDDLTPIEIIGNMCAAQSQENADRAQARLKKSAKFKFDAQAEDIIWDATRGLEKPAIRGLLTGDWIRRKENLLLSGSSGVGKSWLGCALGNSAIRAGYSARYFRVLFLRSNPSDFSRILASATDSGLECILEKKETARRA